MPTLPIALVFITVPKSQGGEDAISNLAFPVAISKLTKAKGEGVFRMW